MRPNDGNRLDCTLLRLLSIFGKIISKYLFTVSICISSARKKIAKANIGHSRQGSFKTNTSIKKICWQALSGSLPGKSLLVYYKVSNLIIL